MSCTQMSIFAVDYRSLAIRLAFLSQHQWQWRMLLYTITITFINHLRYIRTSQHRHRWWYRWKCYLRFPMRTRNPCTLIGIHFGIPTYFNLICASSRAIILRKQFQESVSSVGPVFSSFYLFSFDTLKLIYSLGSDEWIVDTRNCSYLHQLNRAYVERAHQSICLCSMSSQRMDHPNHHEHVSGAYSRQRPSTVRSIHVPCFNSSKNKKIRSFDHFHWNFYWYKWTTLMYFLSPFMRWNKT